MDEGRFARGEAVLNEVTKASGKAVVEDLKDISPNWVTLSWSSPTARSSADRA